MNLKKKLISFFLLFIIFESSCHKSEDQYPENRYPEFTNLRFVVKFDSTQERLDNYGNIVSVPAGHSAQSPYDNSILIKAIKFLKDSTFGYDSGAAVYYNSDGSLSYGASYYDNLISSLDAPGTFKYIRIYFYYQKFRIKFMQNGNLMTGKLLSFLWPLNSSYTYQIQDSIVTTDSITEMGEWYLESGNLPSILHGQIPNPPTEPNSLFYSYPVPSQEYIVTSPISPNLFLDRPDSKTITISISTNQCFEWIEHSDPNFFEPFNGDTIVDVGIRGVKVLQ
jgi:hypothetical protein